MPQLFRLRKLFVKYTYLLWLAPLVLVMHGAVSSVSADSGFLKSLSLTAAKGAGPLAIDFTVKEQTLTSTTYTPDATNFDFSFGGTLDFGDGVTPPATGFPLALVKQTKRGGKEGTVVWRDDLQGVVSHTYPAEGTYTATLSHCCLADTYVSYGYVSITSAGEPLEAKVNVTVREEVTGCQEETLFKQIDCQIDKLVEELGAANIGANYPTLNNLLHNQLSIAKNKRAETEAKCAIPNEDKAKAAMTAARVKIHAFATTVDNSPYIDDGVEDVLVSQATPIEDAMNGLIAAGVCSGSQCLPDPPLGALHCETGNLIAAVAQFATDQKLAQFITAKLESINQRRDQIIAACDANKPKLTTGKIKSALGALKSIEAKVNLAEKKGTLPASLIATIRQGSARMKAILDNLLLTGACS